jgi:hypothetical protein
VTSTRTDSGYPTVCRGSAHEQHGRPFAEMAQAETRFKPRRGSDRDAVQAETRGPLGPRPLPLGAAAPSSGTVEPPGIATPMRVLRSM